MGVGLAAAAAAVTANLVLLGQARSEDPMGRLSPALTVDGRPSGTTTGTGATGPGTVTEPPVLTAGTTTSAPHRDGDEDDDHGGGGGHDDD